MGQKFGVQHDYPLGHGTVYWTANQSRTDEYTTWEDGRTTTEIGRCYYSDTGAKCFWRGGGPSAVDKTIAEYWIKGGTPLPGGSKSAWVVRMPFCILGLSRDFVMNEFKASHEIVVTDLGARQVNGEACHGISFHYTGLQIPGSEPSEVWFSDTWNVPWEITSFEEDGSQKWILDLSDPKPWTPDRTILRLPPGALINRNLKQ